MIYSRKLLKIRASTPGEIVQEAQAHLQTSQGVTNVDHIGDVDTLTVGNQEGLEFLKETTDDLQQFTDERASVNRRITRLEERDRINREMICVNRETIRRQQERIRALKSQSEFRSMARMRFISTFKRDYLPEEFDITHADRDCIRDGNSQAHDADPISDADLYQEGKRSD